MAQSNTESFKQELYGYLGRADYEGLSAITRSSSMVARTLIGMSYDKDDPLSWRAIDAIGRLCVHMPEDKLRVFVQRVLWMMREESGNNAWTAAEILGEIVFRRPEPNEDIAPIVVSFHDELIMRAGALRALARIASVRPDLVDAFRSVPEQYLDDPDPAVRGYAVVALIALGAEANRAALERAVKDEGEFLYYENDELISTEISSLAGEALGM